MKTLLSPEPLESRIAPAAFYASGAELTVKNASGVPVASDTDAATFTTSDFVLALAKGDRLYADLDGDVTTTYDQAFVMKVTAGRALVFLKDMGGFFQDGSIVGLAVSDKFAGTVAQSINGDIVTAMTPTGALAHDATNILMQSDAISGLKLTGTGDVFGSIFAGDAINHIVGVGHTVTGKITNEPSQYQEGDAPGIAFAGGRLYTAPSYPGGAAGASINGVILDSVSTIIAQTGPYNYDGGMGGIGGAGGSISNVWLNNASDVTIKAGKGQQSNVGAKAGVGGSVKNVHVVFTSSANVAAGDGGFTAGTATSATGGSLSDIHLTSFSEGAVGSLVAGWAGFSFGPGANGGSITNCSAQLEGDFSRLTVNAGQASSGDTSGSGGVGGSIVGSSIILGGLNSRLSAMVGGGGGSNTAKGGAGGSYIDDSVVIKGQIIQEAPIFQSGFGGYGLKGGGAAGDISGCSLHLIGAGSSLLSVSSNQDLHIDAGYGGGVSGSGGLKSIRSGKGGSITNFDFTMEPGTSLPGGIYFTGGNGGLVSDGGSGGVGGAITNVTLDLGGAVGTGSDGYGLIVITGGTGGGSGLPNTGDGGSGGSVTGLTLLNHGTYGPGAVTRIEITGGTGGDASGTGTGGIGGVVGSATAPVTVRLGAAAALSQDLIIMGGAGGHGAIGGMGGGVSTTDVSLTDARAVKILGGTAGASYGGKGAAGGSVNTVSLATRGNVGWVDIKGGLASAGTGTFSGGKGGDVKKLNYVNYGEIVGYGVVFFLDIKGGDGGNSPTTGGAGGVVSASTMTSFGKIDGTAAISGGVGGHVSAGAAGAGGAVTSFTLRDYYGNTTSITGGFGGGGAPYGGLLQAGQAGVGGAVNGVKLDASGGTVQIAGGLGGYGDVGALPLNHNTGGAGGSVSTISGVVGRATIIGGIGGDGADAGGAGGNVSGVDLLVTTAVDILAGGEGGASSVIGGAGGKVSNIDITGDIGLFDTGQGGLFAGRGGPGVNGGANGINGSIMDVSADRIATIYARSILVTLPPFPSPLDVVTKISGVVASVIGFDLNSNGVFDFSDDGNGIFNLGIDDAFDGFVLVQASGITATSFSTPPLMLIKV